MRISSFLVLSLMFVLVSACTHSLHVSHVSDFSPTFKEYSKGELVKSKTEQFTVMGFVSNTDYVDTAYKKLQDACPKGTVQGITTQYSTSHGFFSWTNIIEMQGLCIN